MELTAARSHLNRALPRVWIKQKNENASLSVPISQAEAAFVSMKVSLNIQYLNLLAQSNFTKRILAGQYGSTAYRCWHKPQSTRAQSLPHKSMGSHCFGNGHGYNNCTDECIYRTGNLQFYNRLTVETRMNIYDIIQEINVDNFKSTCNPGQEKIEAIVTCSFTVPKCSIYHFQYQPSK